MKTLRRGFLVVATAALLTAQAHTACAQVDDHLKCYRINDPLKLKGIVDMESPQLGLEPGCRISRAILFCVPTTKRVVEAFDKSSRPPRPIGLLPIDGPPAPGDRICYRIKCKKPFPPEQEVTDQFGNRVISKLKPFILCTPAIKGGPPAAECPNGVLEPGEQCDPPDDAACPGLCKTDCTCGVEIDQFPNTSAVIEIATPAGSERVALSGPTTVHVDLGSLGDPDGNGHEQVQTEIVSMELTGVSPSLGVIQLRAGAALGFPSPGILEEKDNRTAGVLDIPPFTGAGVAESFFDVFFEIEVPGLGMKLHNDIPKHMGAVITHKPPAEGETYGDPGSVPLLDENGNPTGISVGAAGHTPNPGPRPQDAPCECRKPCDFVCPDGKLVQGQCVIGTASGDCFCAALCRNLSPLCAFVGQNECTNDQCRLLCPSGEVVTGICEVPDPKGCLCTNLGTAPCQ